MRRKRNPVWYTRHNLFPSDHPAGTDRLSGFLRVSVYEQIVNYLLMIFFFYQIVQSMEMGLQGHPAVYGGTEKL